MFAALQGGDSGETPETLGLFVHLHALVTDGVFADDDGAPRWFAEPSVTTEVIAGVLATGVDRHLSRA